MYYPIKLLHHMNTLPIEYGFYDFKNKKNITTKDPDWNWKPEFFKERYNIIMPSVLEELKIGTCFDTALYAYSLLENYYDTLLCFVETVECYHHMMTYYNSGKNRWYWFEYSWDLQKGLHGPYDSKEQLLENFLDVYVMMRSEGRKCIKNVVKEVNAEKLLSYKTYVSCEDFYNIVYSTED